MLSVQLSPRLLLVSLSISALLLLLHLLPILSASLFTLQPLHVPSLSQMQTSTSFPPSYTDHIRDNQSEGYRTFLAIAVTSQVPSPTISPCGICRQVLREFLPLQAPIFMAASTYPTSSHPPSWLRGDRVDQGGEAFVKVMTLDELLPMSFGPEQLDLGL